MQLKPKANIKYSKQRGFTLLELMVVLVIIGSLLGMVTVIYQVDDGDEAMQQTGQSLRLFLQHQTDKSWLDGETLGATINNQMVSISVFDLEKEAWETSELTWTVENEGVEISLIRTDPQADNEIESSSLVQDVDIAFVASGEYTPFEILINMVQQTDLSKRYVLKGDGVNALELKEN